MNGSIPEPHTSRSYADDRVAVFISRKGSKRFDSTPISASFVSTAASSQGWRPYYSTLAHELTHWTGAKHRLNRQLANRFGSQAYAMEELIAELGAAFTCARLGIQTEPRRDHAPYIAAWLNALRGDARAIFTAASKAQEAADYLSRLGAPDTLPIEQASALPAAGLAA